MGCTFAAALVKKTGAPGRNPTAPATRKAIREGFERMGYVKAANAEDAALVLPLHHDKKSAWLTIALEMPEDPDQQTELLRQLSAEMHTPILYFMNFDSDFLYMAALFGYTAEALFVDEDAEPFAVLGFDPAGDPLSHPQADDSSPKGDPLSHPRADDSSPKGDPLSHPQADDSSPKGRARAVPLMMPEDAPPAFTKNLAAMGYGNPVSMRINPCGGAGKGIRVLMQADGYAAEDWRAAAVRLSNEANRRIGRPAPQEYTAQVVPQPVAFRDGRKGWKAEFPDAPIFPGVTPESPLTRSPRANAVYEANGYDLSLVFTGGKFRNNELQLSEKTHIWVVPMENPAGAIHHSSPRQKLRIIPYWMSADEKNE